MVSLVLFTACTTTESHFKHNLSLNRDNSATVFIYRPYTDSPKFDPEKPFIFIDEKKLGKFGENSNIKIRLPRGSYKITIKSSFMQTPYHETDRFELNIDEHKDYYLRFGDNFTGNANKSHFSLVDESVGKQRK